MNKRLLSGLFGFILFLNIVSGYTISSDNIYIGALDADLLGGQLPSYYNQSLDDTFDVGKEIDGANSLANSFMVGDGIGYIGLSTYDFNGDSIVDSVISTNTERNLLYLGAGESYTDPNLQIIGGNLAGESTIATQMIAWGAGGLADGSTSFEIYLNHDNKRLTLDLGTDGTIYLETNANGGVALDGPNNFYSVDDASTDLGMVTERFRDLYLSGSLSDATDSLTVAEAKTAYDKRVDTWGDGLSYSSQTANVNVDDSTIEIDTNVLRVKADGIGDSHIDWGHNAGQVNSDDIPDHDGHSVRDTFTHTLNRGVAEEITVTLTGGLNVAWTSGELYDTSTDTFISITAGSGTLTDHSLNYLKWVSGTTLTLATSGSSGSEILVSRFGVYDGVIASHREVSLMSESTSKMRRALRHVMPNQITDGMVVSEDTDVTNNLDVVMSAGVLWKDILEQVTPSEIKSRNTAMVRHFHTGGAWTYDTNAEIDTANYDDGTNRVDLPNNKYVKAVFIFQANKIGWVYPTEYFNNKAEALEAPLPALPIGLADSPRLTAIVYKTDATDFTDTTWQDVRAGKSQESFTGVTDHGSLSGLTDDDHTQYLLADGSRALAGAWDMNNQALTNVNLDSGDINVAVTNTEWDVAYTHSQVTTGNPHSLTLTDLDSYNHNDLQNIDGGTYHLNIGNYSALTDTNAQLTALHTDGSPSFAGLTIDNLNLNGNIISSTTGDIDLSSNSGLINSDSAILSQGTHGSGWTETSLGAGTRLLWYPRKSAFRAGYVSGTEWDNTNIGEYSTAFGYNTEASGLYSTAFGFETEASSLYSTAFGEKTIASGSHSTAFGREITVAGEYSFGIALNDQNGATINQNNAMVIMGGNVGIGTITPSSTLEVVGDLTVDELNLDSNMITTTGGNLVLDSATDKLQLNFDQIYRQSGNGVLEIYGGDSVGDGGANVELFGGNHASTADTGNLRIESTDILTWTDSGVSLNGLDLTSINELKPDYLEVDSGEDHKYPQDSVLGTDWVVGDDIGDYSGWDDHFTGANSKAEITASIDGHSNVLMFEKYTSAGDDAKAIYTMPTALESGYISFWMRTSNINKYSGVFIYDGSANHAFNIYMVSGLFKTHDGSNWHEITSAKEDTWYHIVFEFDSSTDEHKIYINGELAWEYEYNTNAGNINTIDFEAWHDGDTYDFYIDRIYTGTDKATAFMRGKGQLVSDNLLVKEEVNVLGKLKSDYIKAESGGNYKYPSPNLLPIIPDDFNGFTVTYPDFEGHDGCGKLVNGDTWDQVYWGSHKVSVSDGNKYYSSFWLYIPDSGRSGNFGLGWWLNSDNYAVIIFQVLDNTIDIYNKGAGTGAYDNEVTSYEEDEWFHIVFEMDHDDDKFRTYINNNMVSEVDFNGVFASGDYYVSLEDGDTADIYYYDRPYFGTDRDIAFMRGNGQLVGENLYVKDNALIMDTLSVQGKSFFNGKIGLGTNDPARRIHIKNQYPEIQFTDSDTDKSWHMGGNANDFNIVETGVTNRISIKDNGDTYVYDEAGKIITRTSTDGGFYVYEQADQNEQAVVKMNGATYIYGSDAWTYTADHFGPNTHKTKYLGSSSLAWDEVYGDNFHNTGPAFIETQNNKLLNELKDINFVASTTMNNSVGKAEIDLTNFPDYIVGRERYELQYDKLFESDFKIQLLKLNNSENETYRNYYKDNDLGSKTDEELKQFFRGKETEDLPLLIQSTHKKYPDDMTNQELGVSLNQWLVWLSQSLQEEDYRTVQYTQEGTGKVNNDIAEFIPTAQSYDNYENGDLLCVTEDMVADHCTSEYNKLVVGVVNWEPSFFSNQNSSLNSAPIAVTGAVRVKVDCDQSPIERGDLLTSSPTTSYAQDFNKYTAQTVGQLQEFQGATVGKALQNCFSGQKLIWMWVN